MISSMCTVQPSPQANLRTVLSSKDRPSRVSSRSHRTPMKLWHTTFCVWHSFSWVPPRRSVYQHFLSFYCQTAPHCMATPPSVYPPTHPPADAHLGCFPLLAVVTATIVSVFKKSARSTSGPRSYTQFWHFNTYTPKTQKLNSSLRQLSKWPVILRGKCNQAILFFQATALATAV